MTDIKFILLFYGGWRSVEGLFALPLPVRISELNVRTSAGTSRHYNNTAVNQWSLGQVHKKLLPFFKIELLTH